MIKSRNLSGVDGDSNNLDLGVTLLQLGQVHDDRVVPYHKPDKGNKTKKLTLGKLGPEQNDSQLCGGKVNRLSLDILQRSERRCRLKYDLFASG